MERGVRAAGAVSARRCRPRRATSPRRRWGGGSGGSTSCGSGGRRADGAARVAGVHARAPSVRGAAARRSTPVLVHEAIHVAQQQRAAPTVDVGQPSQAAEREAHSRLCGGSGRSMRRHRFGRSRARVDGGAGGARARAQGDGAAGRSPRTRRRTDVDGVLGEAQRLAEALMTLLDAARQVRAAARAGAAEHVRIRRGCARPPCMRSAGAAPATVRTRARRWHRSSAPSLGARPANRCRRRSRRPRSRGSARRSTTCASMTMRARPPRCAALRRACLHAGSGRLLRRRQVRPGNRPRASGSSRTS